MRKIIFLICFAFLFRALQLYALCNFFDIALFTQENHYTNTYKKTKNVNVNIKNVDLQIEKSKDDNIYIEHNGKIEESTDTLFLTEHIKENNLLSLKRNEAIKIFLPDNVNIIFDTYNSNVEIKNATLTNISDTYSEKTTFTIKNINVTEKMSLRETNDDISIDNSTIQNIEIYTNDDIKVTNSTFNNADFSANYGNVDMENIKSEKFVCYGRAGDTSLNNIKAKTIKIGGRSEIGYPSYAYIKNIEADIINLEHRAIKEASILLAGDAYEVYYEKTNKEEEEIIKNKKPNKKLLFVYYKRHKDVISFKNEI